MKWHPSCIVDISIPSPFVPPPHSPEIYVVFSKTVKSFFTSNINSGLGGGGVTAFKQSCLINERNC